MKAATWKRWTAGVIAVIGIGAGFGAGIAWADYPHMTNARNQLDGAINELRTGSSDFGGHKEQAINLIQQARSEIDQAIEFARQHGGDPGQPQPGQPQPGQPGFFNGGF